MRQCLFTRKGTDGSVGRAFSNLDGPPTQADILEWERQVNELYPDVAPFCVTGFYEVALPPVTNPDT